MALVGIPVALDLRRGASHQSRPLVGDLRATDLVAAEEAFLGSQVRALLVALAAKDGSTEEHTRRVALLAVEIGHELGLPPGRLRALATGGLLHDIGKLAVRDEVLRKPAALTEDEFAEIVRHPGAGVTLLDDLGGFDPLVVSLVNDHHERLDGSGYPRGLRGEQISLEARILGVCDVYDALLSPRVYRAAWPHERAIALLRDGAGTEFDRGCIDALERVLDRVGSGQRAPLRAAASVAGYAAASEAFLSAR
jgi:putative nucleotidyltransferase with HDIG domain